MEFNYGTEPGSYMKYESEGPVNDTSDLGSGGGQQRNDIEGPVLYGGELGQSVTEGSRFGNFVQTVSGAIRTGASKVELQTGMAGGQEAVGAESYGQETRQALREMVKANEIELTSVHVPTQIGNTSGFNPQQGFVDEQRKQAVDEIKKAIDFASETTGGGTITFHTGEYQRPISEEEWAVMRDKNGKPLTDKDGNKKYMFLGYEEEPGKAVTYMVDDRTGKILSDVRKSNVIREPVYKRADKDHEGVDVDGNPVHITKGDLITNEGRYIDPANSDHLFHRVPKWDDNFKRFESEKLTWDEIDERKEDYNRKIREKKKRGKLNHFEREITTEEMAYRIQIENQIMQHRGHSLYHGRFYNDEAKELKALQDSLKYYQELEEKIPKEEVWKIMRSDPKVKRHGGAIHDMIGSDLKKPTDILNEAILQAKQSLQYTHEASASADAQADSLKDTLNHVVPVGEYAKDNTFISMGEAGIHAWNKTVEGKKNGTVTKDIILTPENIFPEMGYGSHPQELKQMVKGARKKMIEMLTEKKIKDPHKRLKLFNGKDGEPHEDVRDIENPWYNPKISKEEAKKLAEKHIKANLDTQHLGMWGKHFQPMYNEKQGRMETPEETKERFMDWYKEQVEDLAKDNIIGETHIVDGYASGGHTHLPAGQGELPVVDAVKILKKHGFKGVMVSEGHGEESWGKGRIITKAWEAFGSPVFSKGYFGSGEGGGFGAPVSFTDISNSYFQKKQGPYFVFGGYSPSNDWSLWSEVPLE